MRLLSLSLDLNLFEIVPSATVFYQLSAIIKLTSHILMDLEIFEKLLQVVNRLSTGNYQVVAQSPIGS
jgi:hypothetical protein